MNIFNSGTYSGYEDLHIAEVKVELDLGRTFRSGPPKGVGTTAPFVKGPLSLAWLGAAAKLPGKTLHMAMALCWLDGMNAGGPFKLNRKALDAFGVSDDAARDALHRLQVAGLITMTQSPGQRPLVSVVKAAREPPACKQTAETAPTSCRLKPEG